MMCALIPGMWFFVAMPICVGNGIGDEGLRALAAGVRRNSALEELRIEGESEQYDEGN